MNIAFFIVLIILLATIYRGWNRGIIGLLYGFASWIFIFVFILLVNPFIYSFMYENAFLHDAVYDKVYPIVDEKVPGYTGNAGEYNNTYRLSSEKSLKEKSLGNQLKDLDVVGDFSKVAGDTAKNIRVNIVSGTTERVCQYIFKSIAIILTYIVAKVIAVTIKVILDKYFEEGVIRDIVYFAGGILGGAEGILYIWIIMYVISLTRMFEYVEKVYGYIQANPLLKLLYENNGFAIFLGKL